MAMKEELTASGQQAIENFLNQLISAESNDPNKILIELNDTIKLEVSCSKKGEKGVTSDKVLSLWNAVSKLESGHPKITALVRLCMEADMSLDEYYKGGKNAPPRRRTIIQHLLSGAASSATMRVWYQRYYFPVEQATPEHLEIGRISAEKIRESDPESIHDPEWILTTVHPANWTAAEEALVDEFNYSNKRAVYIKYLRSLPVCGWSYGLRSFLENLYNGVDFGTLPVDAELMKEMIELAKYIRRELCLFESPWARGVVEFGVRHQSLVDSEIEPLLNTPDMQKWLQYLRCQKDLSGTETAFLDMADELRKVSFTTMSVEQILYSASPNSIETTKSPEVINDKVFGAFLDECAKDWIINELSGRDGRKITTLERWMMLHCFQRQKLKSTFAHNFFPFEFNKAIESYRPGFAGKGNLYLWIKGAMEDFTIKCKSNQKHHLPFEDDSLAAEDIRSESFEWVEDLLILEAMEVLHPELSDIHKLFWKLKKTEFTGPKIRAALKEEYGIDRQLRDINDNLRRINRRIRMKCIEIHSDLLPPFLFELLKHLFPTKNKPIIPENMDQQKSEKFIRRKYQLIVKSVDGDLKTLRDTAVHKLDREKAFFRLAFFAPDLIEQRLRGDKLTEDDISQQYAGTTPDKRFDLLFVLDFEEVWERVIGFLAANPGEIQTHESE